MMFRRAAALKLFGACLLALFSLPHASLAQPPQAFEACQGKSAGDACQVGPGEGTCVSNGQSVFCIPASHMGHGNMGPENMRQEGMGPGGMGPGGMEQGNMGQQQMPSPPQGSSQMQGQTRMNGGPSHMEGRTGMAMNPRTSLGNSEGRGMGPGRAQKYPAPGTATSREETDPIHTGGAFDTAQKLCFSETNVMTCPEPGERLYGQDAQYLGIPLSYTDNGDGTVTDNNTGLTWQQGHNENRLVMRDASRYCEGLTLGGHDDWRLPNIKELYSIVTFDGAAGVKAYLDTDYFDISPPASLSSTDRFASTHSPEMMGQTTSSTIYVGNLWGRGQRSSFFMNFLDGRIKCAPTDRGEKQFYRCVRGPEYGENDFVDNGDGTVTDRSSGLVWQQADDGNTRDWPGALAYCEGLSLAGHDDWRLPNAKELQYILDYSDIPAIDEDVFTQTDPKAWYWTSTTLGDNIEQAVYVCFGKGIAYDGTDVHGAGAQRSDPKTTRQKHGSQQGGQQDDVRVMNLVRCVRN